MQNTNPDLVSCDREPIHLFSSVQAHGCLLAMTWPERRIEMVSENVDEILGIDRKDVLGSRLDHHFQSAFIEEISELIEARPWNVPGHHVNLTARHNEQAFEAYLYESDGLMILELENETSEHAIGNVEVEQVLREFMVQSKQKRSVADLARLVCHSIRRLTGLDRVMMYRFDPNTWHGEVLAEDRVTHSHSYLGHRFPASDIPVPARELYLRNQVRLIPDVGKPSYRLVPALNPRSKKPLDLSDSRLRSVAPVHLEYMRNMKVAASFSVAITYDNRLWGLITCHHLSPMLIPQSLRTACEIIAHTFSIHAPLLEESLDQAERLEFEIKSKMILDSLRLSTHPLNDFFKQHRSVSQGFKAGGLALVGKKLEDFAGITPLRADIEELALWLRTKMHSEQLQVLALDNLSDLDPRWSSVKDYASGILAARIPDINDTLLIFFRPEVLQTITWGGDPRKNLAKKGFEGRMNPRLSFEAWQETLTNHSLPWKKYEVDGILFLRDFVFDGLVKKERLIQELSQELGKS